MVVVVVAEVVVESITSSIDPFMLSQLSSLRLSRLYDGGLQDKLMRQWIGRKIPCEEPSPLTELDFTHTVTAFLILLLGVVCSLLFVIVERIHERKSRESVVSEHDSKAVKCEKVQRRGTKRRPMRHTGGSPTVYVSLTGKRREYSFSSRR